MVNRATAPDVERISVAGQPFLKWPGGKRWLPKQGVYVPVLAEGARYFEPFLGGDSLFFTGHFSEAVLSDINTALITTYRAVRLYPRAIVSRLEAMPNDPDVYRKLAASAPRAPVDRAVRFIYLNRAGFGGLYRVNAKGEFNVPYAGYSDRRILQPERIHAASAILNCANLLAEPAEKAIAAAREGDLVYLDPPYITGHNNNGFVRYNERLFNWQSQVSLAQAARQLRARGVHVLATNAAHPAIEELYKDFWRTRVVRRTNVATSPSNRGSVAELVVASYDGALGA